MQVHPHHSADHQAWGTYRERPPIQDRVGRDSHRPVLTACGDLGGELERYLPTAASKSPGDHPAAYPWEDGVGREHQQRVELQIEQIRIAKVSIPAPVACVDAIEFQRGRYRNRTSGLIDVDPRLADRHLAVHGAHSQVAYRESGTAEGCLQLPASCRQGLQHRAGHAVAPWTILPYSTPRTTS